MKLRVFPDQLYEIVSRGGLFGFVENLVQFLQILFVELLDRKAQPNHLKSLAAGIQLFDVPLRKSCDPDGIAYRLQEAFVLEFSHCFPNRCGADGKQIR